jgi:hypothetical protein
MGDDRCPECQGPKQPDSPICADCDFAWHGAYLAATDDRCNCDQCDTTWDRDRNMDWYFAVRHDAGWVERWATRLEHTYGAADLAIMRDLAARGVDPLGDLFVMLAQARRAVEGQVATALAHLPSYRDHLEALPLPAPMRAPADDSRPPPLRRLSARTSLSPPTSTPAPRERIAT